MGKYICEVTKENFNTKQVLAFYIDTIEVVKGTGADGLAFREVRKVRLHELKFLGTNAYYGLATVIRFEEKQFLMTSGPDAGFYEFKGVRAP
ncbi:hypothetical protein [Larkinella soli]|uniref:hypothetical protein n=1 Tax=Larkinella soli TaxID=1770527 RepID=UPI000FFC756F|nr:hypothetical protein [Larkinella soli]